MAMMERFNVEMAFILLIIVCAAHCKPQSYNSRKPISEQRQEHRPAPTNEVYSSQLSQPTPVPHRRYTTPSHGVPASGRQSVAKHGGGGGGGGTSTNATVHRHEEQRGVINQNEDSNLNSTHDLDEVIQEIFKEQKMQNDRSVAALAQHGAGGSARPQDKGQFGKSRIKLPGQDNSMIVFPSDSPTTRPEYLQPRSPCPDGLTVCSGVSNYPDSYLRNLMNRVSSFERFFGADELPAMNITQRLDITPDDQAICPAVESVVYPEQGQNKEDNWLYIVQTKRQNIQGVRIETCRYNDERACMHVDVMYGYQSFCKQKYIYRKMVALHPSDGSPITDDFKLPSCCSCHVRQVDLSTRMGFDPTTQSKAKSRRRRNKNHQQEYQRPRWH